MNANLHIDADKLFESTEHLKDIVASAGLCVKDQLIAPYYKKTVKETVEQKLPLNIALELGH